MREAFAYHRTNFLNAVEAAFGRRRLNEMSVPSPKFARMLAAFKKQSRAFPLSENLAQLWALGKTGNEVQVVLISGLREIMDQPVRPGAWPENLKLSQR